MKLIDRLKTDFQIARLTGRDATDESDHLMAFRDLVSKNEAMYPGIDAWLKKKVIPGIRSLERTAYVGYLEEEPVVSAVVKKGHDAKICHLRIDKELEDCHLGEIFFSLMAIDVGDFAKNIHFTLPESLWERKGGFFQSFGFHTINPCTTQYRLWDEELTCSAYFPKVWDAVLRKIPRISDLYSLRGAPEDESILMSIQPKYAERILSGRKKVEIRRTFSRKWLGHKINLYASRPNMSLVGEARIAAVTCDEPEAVWERYNDSVGCTREEFNKYVATADKVFAIELDEVIPYRDPVSARKMSEILKENLRPPQSYFALEKNTPWARAVSVASLLHRGLRESLISSFNNRISSCLKVTGLIGKSTNYESCSQGEFYFKEQV